MEVESVHENPPETRASPETGDYITIIDRDKPREFRFRRDLGVQYPPGDLPGWFGGAKLTAYIDHVDKTSGPIRGNIG